MSAQSRPMPLPPPVTRTTFPSRTPMAEISLMNGRPLFEAVGPAQVGEQPGPDRGDEEGADAAEDRRPDGSQEPRHDPALELAELVGGADEHRGDGGDTAAHRVRRD